MDTGFLRVRTSAAGIATTGIPASRFRTDVVVGVMLAALLLLDWLVLVAVVFGLIGGWFDA